MIGSVNVPFPSNMTRQLPRRGIDDPRWSLTALTGDPRGSETACRRCNRRECSCFTGLRCCSAVSGFTRRAQDSPQRPLWRFHVAQYGPENRSSLMSLMSWMVKTQRCHPVLSPQSTCQPWNATPQNKSSGSDDRSTVLSSSGLF